MTIRSPSSSSASLKTLASMVKETENLPLLSHSSATNSEPPVGERSSTQAMIATDTEVTGAVSSMGTVGDRDPTQSAALTQALTGGDASSVKEGTHPVQSFSRK